MDILLRFPGRSHIVIQIRYMEAGFVAHLEHTHQSGSIGQHIVETELGRSHTHVEELVQLGLGLLVSSHQGKESFQIVFHVPIEDIGIILGEVSASVVHGIKGLHPLSLIVLGPHHAFIGAEDITVKLRAFHKEFLVLCLT